MSEQSKDTITLGQLDPQQRLDVARGVDDSARLPVVAWAQENLKDIFEFGSKVAVISAKASVETNYTFPLCDAIAANTLLDEKNARIAELERQAVMGGGLSRLALNAARDQLASAEAALDKAQALNVELRAQLQAAPAERGVVLPKRKARPDGWGFDPLINDGWNACLDEVARLNPEPATADSDVRGVSE